MVYPHGIIICPICRSGSGGGGGGGNAGLELKLQLPVRQIAQSRVQGTVTLAGNDLQVTPDSPQLSRARGAGGVVVALAEPSAPASAPAWSTCAHPGGLQHRLICEPSLSLPTRVSNKDREAKRLCSLPA